MARITMTLEFNSDLNAMQIQALMKRVQRRNKERKGFGLGFILRFLERSHQQSWIVKRVEHLSESHNHANDELNIDIMGTVIIPKK